MAFYPKKWNQFCPSSLAAIILATAANMIFKFDVSVVGEIPKTIFLSDRLSISLISLENIKHLFIPAVSIAALGLIESLLCGACAGRMKNEKLNSDQELIAQGIGNMIIPFFGGVPATAAIARTSVAIKSGGQTRITGIVHSAVLLLSMFALGGVMSAIPLSALAGVLIVTAWRMNEWEVIKDFFGRKIKTAMAQFLITMLATVVFDLTIAIVIGVVFSIVLFVVKVSDMQISISSVDPEKLDNSTKFNEKHKRTSVIYIAGPLYFGTANKLEEKLSEIEEKDILIFSMRGVPLADISGVQALERIILQLSENNTAVYFTCVQPAVMELFERWGMKQKVGEENFFWSTDKALNQIK